MKILLLYGGGIDSTTALIHLVKAGHAVEAIFFRYGQKAEELEFKACSYFCSKWGVPLKEVTFDWSMLGSSSAILSGSNADSSKVADNLLEGRNVIFLSLAASYASAKKIHMLAVGFHREPETRPFPDASPEFLTAFTEVLWTGFRPSLSLLAPFKAMTRREIYMEALSIDGEIMTHAHTCYENVEDGCGTCVHCVLKSQLLGELL